ncbi:MAG: transketolase [Magnetococcales bacterium]|nr:transketolase [Magnetococcales bacterium]
MHYHSRIGHIGGNLSCLQTMLLLHHHIMEKDDVFVLSKGHAIGALYITLWTLGEIDDAALTTFHADGTRLAGHPVAQWHPRIPVATGSLGHGLPMAIGMTLAKKLRCEPGRIFCLTSDGEWQEGSNWEALIFANHHQLERLTILVDQNGWQGFGSTSEVASMANLAPRLAAFGPRVTTVNGHDPQAMLQEISLPPQDNPGPRILMLETIKGYGISFMENRLDSHYLPLDQAGWKQAMRELASREAS